MNQTGAGQEVCKRVLFSIKGFMGEGHYLHVRYVPRFLRLASRKVLQDEGKRLIVDIVIIVMFSCPPSACHSPTAAAELQKAAQDQTPGRT